MNRQKSSGDAAITKKPAFNLKALAHEMERLARLEAVVLEQEPDRDFLSSARLTGLGLFRLVVMGEIKKGKSSFINALLGTKDLVPVHSDVATSTIFKIHYGPETKYTVYFEKESGKDKQEIHAAQLTEFGTEAGNPKNEKQVDFIRVESPAPLLRNGLIVVDTPGVGGLFKKHREITFRHAPNADAVFFVTESIAAPIGADEVKFLKELRQVTELITFVQTKCAKADADARRARMSNNLSIIEEQVGLKKEEISYFIIDSGLKIEADESHDRDDLEDSGFLPLMAYLNNTLRRRRESHVAKAAFTKATAKLIETAASLDRQKQILDADTEEKRRQLDQEYAALQQRLTEWDRSTRSKILDDLRKGLNGLTRNAQDELSPIKPGGRIQQKFEHQIDQATDKETLRSLMKGVESDLAALTSKAYLQIAECAKSEANKLLHELGQNALATMDATLAVSCHNQGGAIDVNLLAVRRVIDNRESDEIFKTMRTGAYGFMAGGAIAWVVGSTVGSVIPVVGTIVGGFVGQALASVWGARSAIRMQTEGELRALKREGIVALQQAMASAHQAASAKITNLMSDIQMAATSLVENMIAKATANLAEERAKLAENQKATQQEIHTKKKRHDTLARELNDINKRLETFRSAIPK